MEFVIYVDVEESKTVFLSPSRHNQMNQWGYLGDAFPLDFSPKVSPGNIIIFPSFIEHFVPPGNEGITISGNIYYDHSWRTSMKQVGLNLSHDSSFALLIKEKQSLFIEKRGILESNMTEIHFTY